MTNNTKKWMIIASFLVLAGCLIFGGVMTMLGWDFRKLSITQYENNDHILQETFENIEVISNTADITIQSSQDGNSKVSCYEQKNLKHKVTVEDGTLRIEIIDTRKWYEWIGINFDSAKIQIYLPKSIYGTLCIRSNTSNVEIGKNLEFASIDVTNTTGDIRCFASATEEMKLKTGTGDIQADTICAGFLDLTVNTGNVTAKGLTCTGDISLSVSTGKVDLTDVTCKNFRSTGITGDIALHHVIAAEKYSIERTTGDVTFQNCDAAQIRISTNTGDINGSLMTEKVFIAETNTGHVDVPKTTSGGTCELSTNTGDIQILIN